jgi:hypothetical protein
MRSSASRSPTRGSQDELRGKRGDPREPVSRQLVELVEGRGGRVSRAGLVELPDPIRRDRMLVRSLEERPAKLAVFLTGVGTRAFSATDALG